MAKGTVLIIAKDKDSIAKEIKKNRNFKIDILEKITLNKEIVKEINGVKYDRN